MIEVLLKRTYLPDRTLGEFTIFKDNIEKARLHSLELKWDNNKVNKSCILEGEYIVIPFNSETHPNTYMLLDVKGRNSILIHVGNFIFDSLGCILVGTALADLDKDGIQEIANSKKAIKILNDIIGTKQFKLIIIS